MVSETQIRLVMIFYQVSHEQAIDILLGPPGHYGGEPDPYRECRDSRGRMDDEYPDQTDADWQGHIE